MLETTKHHEHLSSGPTSFAARWIVKYCLDRFTFFCWHLSFQAVLG